MQDHYDRLALSPGATLAEIKAAYHAKLREFPAHTHPQEFKAIRTAYETLRKAPQGAQDFFAEVPIQATLDSTLLSQLQQRASAEVAVSFLDLIRLTL